MTDRPPSGLFPADRAPERPTYREPHPVRGWPLFAGLAAGCAWLLLFGLLAHDLRGYAWWTAVAGLIAWLVALGLAQAGDRGVAVGVAIATAFGWAIATCAIAARWISTGDWPLW